jgi:hypothetical protein
MEQTFSNKLYILQNCGWEHRTNSEKKLNEEYTDVSLPAVCSTGQHCFILNSGAFLKYLISAKAWTTTSFTTFSCFQTGIAIHHIPLYSKGYIILFSEKFSISST